MEKTSTILKNLRVENGYTQYELAAKLGIGQSTIVGYEKGDREATAKILCLYADFFNVSTDYLLGREDDFGNIVVNAPTAPAPLTDAERELLTAFRALKPNMQEYMLGNMRMLAAQTAQL